MENKQWQQKAIYQVFLWGKRGGVEAKKAVKMKQM